MALKNWLENSGRVVLTPWLHKGLVRFHVVSGVEELCSTL